MAGKKFSMAIGGNRDMPRLERRNGIYQAVFFDPSLKRMRRHSLRTRDAAVAGPAFAKLLNDSEGPLQPKYPGRLKVGLALDQYMSEHVDIRCADPGRQRAAATYLNWFFRGLFIADIDIPLSRGYAEGRRLGIVGSTWKPANKGANSTIKRELSVLNAAARHALKWRRIKTLPTIEVPKVWVIGGQDQFKFFSREQIAMLLFHARGETRDRIKLAYYTGARRASIENLTVGQIDFARKRINLATPGKRQTQKRQPVVPLFDVLEADLRRLVAGKEPGNLLFRPTDFYAHFKAICRELNFEEPYFPHMLRHSRATHLLLDGKSIYNVAGLLGDTIKTVETHYAHSGVAELLEALEPKAPL